MPQPPGWCQVCRIRGGRELVAEIPLTRVEEVPRRARWLARSGHRAPHGDLPRRRRHRGVSPHSSGADARFFADILLTPAEATRIRLVSNPKYASGMVPAFTKIVKTEGFGSLYAGFIPILCKQIPYAIGQFTVNERCIEYIYGRMTPEKRKNLTSAQHFGITLTSGIIAGFAAAILSHPADTLLSQINKGHGPEGSQVSRLVALAKQAGFSGLFAGLGPRMSESPPALQALTRSHDGRSRVVPVHHVRLDQAGAWGAARNRDPQGDQNAQVGLYRVSLSSCSLSDSWSDPWSRRSDDQVGYQADAHSCDANRPWHCAVVVSSPSVGEDGTRTASWKRGVYVYQTWSID